jgi:hypothetical protein
VRRSEAESELVGLVIVVGWISEDVVSDSTFLCLCSC